MWLCILEGTPLLLIFRPDPHWYVPNPVLLLLLVRPLADLSCGDGLANK